MNLQEALVYRTECLIHKRDLQPHCISPRACKVEKQVQGIELAIPEVVRRHRELVHYLTLNYDGTWQQESGLDIMSLRLTSVGAIGKVKGSGANLRLLMLCPECDDYGAAAGSFAGRLLTPVAPDLQRLQKHTHNYTILVSSTQDNNFECEIDSETFHYTKDGKFYQVISRPGGPAAFRMGFCGLDTTLSKMEDSLNLEVPGFDFTKVKEIDRLIEKIKIYNLFS